MISTVEDSKKGKVPFRSIFISDVHLSSKGSRAEELLLFLKSCECVNLYLVGDIFDFWHLRKRVFWRKEYTKLMETILKRARKGTRVTYIPGNHDDIIRMFCDLNLGKLNIQRRALHEGADGKTYLVCHGDEYDVVSRYAKWVAVLGDKGYVWLIRLNRMVNRLRRLMGREYWSLSAYVKYRVKKAVSYFSDFEATLVQEARRMNLDGVICGHIHHAELKQLDDMVYGNCGDWVESCTALVEHFDGRLELIRWLDYTKTTVEVEHLAARQRSLQEAILTLENEEEEVLTPLGK